MTAQGSEKQKMLADRPYHAEDAELVADYQAALACINRAPFPSFAMPVE